jgi:hypothetical protein
MQNLRPINDRLPPDRGTQIRAFLCVRNEVGRLPFLLDHYRGNGVGWFFAIDNDSDDGTRELLDEQPDCTVFHTIGGYAASHFGMDWINALQEQYGVGHWCLFVDADEILVYPHAEEMPLPAFCHYLQANDYDGVYAFLMDMYSECAVAQARYTTGQSFLDVCPLFDPDYRFLDRVRLPGTGEPFPPFEVVGGPRQRRFYPEFVNKGILRHMRPRALAKLRKTRLGRALRMNQWLRGTNSPPLLSKIPLMFGVPGRFYVTTHRTTPLRLAPVTGALLHFKFFSDFHERVTASIAEGQHFDGGTEYAHYAAALRKEPNVSLAFAGSLPYTGSTELLARGFIRTSPDWEMFWSSRKADPRVPDPVLQNELVGVR